MVTFGGRLYFGLMLFALVAACVLGVTTGGTVLGVVTFAWAGPVGAQFAYTTFVGLAAVSFFLGTVATAFRDADPDAQVALLVDTGLPAANPPAESAAWPLVAALGAGASVIGLVLEPMLFIGGLVLMAVAAIEWTVLAWSDRATGDPSTNKAIRNGLMAPLEIPGIAVVGVATFVYFASRGLLASSKTVAVVVFAVAAAAILGAAALLASRPKIPRGLLVALLVVGGLVLVGGGIMGLAID